MQILDIAKDNYLRAASLDESSLPQDGTGRWPSFRTELASAIRAFKTHTEAIHHGQSLGIFDHRITAAGNEVQLLVYRHVLQYEYPHFAPNIDQFADSRHSLPRSLALVNQTVAVSNVMYFDLFYILTCLTYLRGVARVCEIGGGYGEPAWLWLTNPIQPIENYTIVDLPESLFFAECFLRASLPDHEVIYCLSRADCANSKPKAIYLVPHANAHLTSGMTFDLVCNTGSLAELPDNWVVFWTEWLNAQQCDAFYSHNLFGTPIDRLQEGRNIFAPRVPPGWRLSYLRFNTPLMVLQSTDRNAAEAIMVRAQAPTSVAWIYDLQRMQEPEMVTLRGLAYYLFNLPGPHDADAAAEVRFLRKSLEEFRQVPKELLYLARRIAALPSFTLLPDSERAFVAAEQSRLEASYRASYPKGRHVL